VNIEEENTEAEEFILPYSKDKNKCFICEEFFKVGKL